MAFRYLVSANLFYRLPFRFSKRAKVEEEGKAFFTLARQCEGLTVCHGRAARRAMFSRARMLRSTVA
jgi:hypothetical protein